MWLSNSFKRVVLASIFALSLSASLLALEEGDAAPDFGTYGLAGELPDLDGKIVYLDFWASWCGPCKASFPAMQDVYEKYKDKGFVVLAVSVDEKEKDMDRFLSRMKTNFPNVWDAQHKLVEHAKVATMPTSFLIGRDGLIKSRHKGWLGDRSKKKLIEEIEEELSHD